jgi:hypothetical protein
MSLLSLIAQAKRSLHGHGPARECVSKRANQRREAIFIVHKAERALGGRRDGHRVNPPPLEPAPISSAGLYASSHQKRSIQCLRRRRRRVYERREAGECSVLRQVSGYERTVREA